MRCKPFPLHSWRQSMAFHRTIIVGVVASFIVTYGSLSGSVPSSWGALTALQ